MGTTHSADALSNGTHGEKPGLLDLIVLLADVRVADAHLDDPGTCIEHSSLVVDITSPCSLVFGRSVRRLPRTHENERMRPQSTPSTTRRTFSSSSRSVMGYPLAVSARYATTGAMAVQSLGDGIDRRRVARVEGGRGYEARRYADPRNISLSRLVGNASGNGAVPVVRYPESNPTDMHPRQVHAPGS